MCNPQFFQKCCHFRWLWFDFRKNDNTFERNEDCATVFLKWTDFRIVFSSLSFVFWKNWWFQKLLSRFIDHYTKTFDIYKRFRNVGVSLEPTLLTAGTNFPSRWRYMLLQVWMEYLLASSRNSKVNKVSSPQGTFSSTWISSWKENTVWNIFRKKLQNLLRKTDFFSRQIKTCKSWMSSWKNCEKKTEWNIFEKVAQWYHNTWASEKLK